MEATMKTVTHFAGELGFVTTILRGECKEDGCSEAVRFEGDYCYRHVDAHMCSRCGCTDCAEHKEVR